MPSVIGKGSVFSQDVLKLVFNGTAIDNIAANQTGTGATTYPLQHYSVALHTTPGPDETTATQDVNETGYTGYQRELVPRTGWSVTNADPSVATPAAAITFQTGTGAPDTVTNASVGMPTIVTATVTSANPGVISSSSHGFTAGMRFAFGGVTVPGNTSASTVYYVSTANVTAGTFEFATATSAASASTSTTGTSVLIIAAKKAVATKVLYAGLVSPNITTGSGVTPTLTATSHIDED